MATRVQHEKTLRVRVIFLQLCDSLLSLLCQCASEWHDRAHAARPGPSAHPGISGPSGKAIFLARAGPGRANLAGPILHPGRAGPSRAEKSMGRAAGFGLSCHSDAPAPTHPS